jgi:hypothetical protein
LWGIQVVLWTVWKWKIDLNIDILKIKGEVMCALNWLKLVQPSTQAVKMTILTNPLEKVKCSHYCGNRQTLQYGSILLSNSLKKKSISHCRNRWAII